jgi:hypothetical protein
VPIRTWSKTRVIKPLKRKTMKKIINISVFLIALLSFRGCEKKELLTINGEIAPNEMDNLSKTEYVLSLGDADQTFETFSWTAPDYGFNAAITYTVQADVSGNEFAGAFDIVTVTHSTSASVTVGEFNQLMLEAELSPDTPHSLEFRVESVVNDNVDPVYSVVKTATVTAYPTDFPPIYMIGDATGGWDLALAVVMYTTGAPGEYSIINEWTNDGAFRFFDAPDWNATKQWNWTYFEGGTVDANFENANDGDTNIRFIGTSGFYRITVNFATKTISLEPVEKPRRLLVGSAMPGGWDIQNPTEMTFISDGVFEVTSQFINDKPDDPVDPENTFRVFWKNDWTAGWNYPYYVGEGYTISDLFEDALDGDNNFRFLGPTGNYTFSLNEWEKTITMVAAE